MSAAEEEEEEPSLDNFGGGQDLVHEFAVRVDEGAAPPQHPRVVDTADHVGSSTADVEEETDFAAAEEEEEEEQEQEQAQGGDIMDDDDDSTVIADGEDDDGDESTVKSEGDEASSSSDGGGDLLQAATANQIPQTQKEVNKKKEKSKPLNKDEDPVSSNKRGRSPSVVGLTIPFRTIKKAMKLDPDIPIVQNEAAVMTTIAAELFLKSLAKESLQNANRRGRNTIKYEDIAEARTNNPSLAFLETLLP